MTVCMPLRRRGRQHTHIGALKNARLGIPTPYLQEGALEQRGKLASKPWVERPARQIRGKHMQRRDMGALAGRRKYDHDLDAYHSDGAFSDACPARQGDLLSLNPRGRCTGSRRDTDASTAHSLRGERANGDDV